ncbi:MAG TPA: acyl-CoA dehydrogenase family protein [Acidimicrobiia bacterium]|nr:acyl-CoA dehydrogenase family protein [Acidimicrobiia bacterium]
MPSTTASPTVASQPDDVTVERPDPVAGTRALAPLLEASSAANEAGVTLCPEVVDALHDRSLFRILVPACLGGYELGVREAYTIIEEASRADGATGWSLMAGAIYLAVAGAFLPDEGAEAVLADPRSVAAGQVAPLGTAGPSDGGWSVEGRFGFASGGLHSTWFYGGFREQRDGETVLLDNGLPSIVVGILPAASVELLGNWDVVGLIGTGSVDYRVPQQFLAEAFTFPLFTAAPRRGHPRFRMGLAGLTCIGHCAFATGVARRALDELATLARTKRRLGRANLIDDPLFQATYARAEGQLAAARAFSLAAIEALETAAIADAVTAPVRAMARLATTHTAEAALEVAGAAFRFAGSTGLRNGSALQRCYRDLSAGEQHVFTDFNTYRDAGRLLLGVGPDTLLT